MRTALRFERYTGWDFEYDPGGEISAADAMRILEDGFDALARWMEWSRPVPVRRCSSWTSEGRCFQ